MNSMPVGNHSDFSELSWKEHTKLFRQAIFSWRFFGIVIGVNILLMLTIGIVLQTVFLFSFVRAFLVLARLSQPFYTAFLFIADDKRLPRTLPKPPLSAFLSSILPILISVFFLYVGIIVLQQTGFCAQSFGCIIGKLIQAALGK